MKKFFFTCACFAFLLFACSDFSNLQIPESVSVKSSAVFELLSSDEFPTLEKTVASKYDKTGLAPPHNINPIIAIIK